MLRKSRAAGAEYIDDTWGLDSEADHKECTRKRFPIASNMIKYDLSHDIPIMIDRLQRVVLLLKLFCTQRRIEIHLQQLLL